MGARIRSAMSSAALCVAFLASLGAGAASANDLSGAGSPSPSRAAYSSCSDAAPAFHLAAAENAVSLDSLDWSPFGPPEKGWQAYEPLVGREIGVGCGAGTPRFAEALAAFQTRWALPSTGRMDAATFQVFKGLWQERRPFVMMRVQGLCPDAPPLGELEIIRPEEETFGRTDRTLRADALAAWRRMTAAARAQVAAIRNDSKALTIFSGFRSPEADEQRCLVEGNCDGGRRATCSAHRTGTAVDLNVGWIDGDTADQARMDNRKWQVRSPAYLWLVANAARFGFYNYAFEPWHWEYVNPDRPLRAERSTVAAAPAAAAGHEAAASVGPMKPDPTAEAPAGAKPQ